ncbi:MAG TPA: hypothetical protein ENO20_03245 [Bacteroides sp.]|nr:hypothetical protein [Bacteroides sp.]
MISRRILPCLAILFLLSSCEFESYRDYRVPPYEGIFTWNEVTDEASWCNRFDHTSVWYGGRLWIMGGYNPGKVKGDTYLEDVWSSADGAEWTLVNPSAPWLGRRGHASVVFDDGSGEAIYVIGGFTVNEENGYREYRNDVWRSTDGAVWTQIKERTCPELDSLYDWFPRFNHTCLVATHGGTRYIYLIGGATMLEDHNTRYSMMYFNDVWRSVNGITWERLPNDDFGIRSEHASTVDPATGRMYIQGGRHGVIFESEENGTHPLPDWQWLWSSDDGISWTPANDTAEFNQSPLWRAEHQIIYYGESLFGLPGKSNSNTHFHFSRKEDYTTWRLDPGNLWSVDSEGSDFGARYGYSVVIHEGRVWVLGGDTGAGGPANDVWCGQID